MKKINLHNCEFAGVSVALWHGNKLASLHAKPDVKPSDVTKADKSTVHFFMSEDGETLEGVSISNVVFASLDRIPALIEHVRNMEKAK